MVTGVFIRLRIKLISSASYEGVCTGLALKQRQKATRQRRNVRCHDSSLQCNTITSVRSISPRSVQLSPIGSELSWGLLADQSESRKFLCSNMEGLRGAQIGGKNASRKCTAQFQAFAIISRYKVTFWV